MIPWLVTFDNSLPRVGVTGEDLLEENYAGFLYDDINRPAFLRKLGLCGKGAYENALFGLPALCVLSKQGMPVELFRKKYDFSSKSSQEINNAIRGIGDFDLAGKKGAAPVRYKHLIKRKVAEADCVEWQYLDGKVDVTIASDVSFDAAIDVVVTGKTIQETGLGIEAVLFLSDGVVIGNQAAAELMCKSKSYKTDQLEGTL